MFSFLFVTCYITCTVCSVFSLLPVVSRAPFGRFSFVTCSIPRTVFLSLFFFFSCSVSQTVCSVFCMLIELLHILFVLYSNFVFTGKILWFVRSVFHLVREVSHALFVLEPNFKVLNLTRFKSLCWFQFVTCRISRAACLVFFFVTCNISDSVFSDLFVTC